MRDTQIREKAALTINPDAANRKADDERRSFSARLEPFDSYWQGPDDVESGYDRFYQYYKHNFLRHLPSEKTKCILVVSCGPGYLVNLLGEKGYTDVTGIDSDPDKVEFARKRNLNCVTAEAYSFLKQQDAVYDAIVCEQELNHLTLDEMIVFLRLCRDKLRPGGTLVVYGLNGSNPIVGAENLAHNIDHFNTFTEYSLRQVLEHVGLTDVKVFPLKLYVFWKNPLNYVGLVVTGGLSFLFRLLFVLYGKDAKIFSKKLAATCRNPI